MAWDEAFRRGHAAMDAAHQEYVGLVDALAAASLEEAPAIFARTVRHLEAHFQQESRWMQESFFPAIHIHLGEHARRLAEWRALEAAGDAAALRGMAESLMNWFLNHLATMDSALARHMKAVGYEPENCPGDEGPGTQGG
jgi:hemerythrin-like metal-binding protein